MSSAFGLLGLGTSCCAPVAAIVVGIVVSKATGGDIGGFAGFVRALYVAAALFTVGLALSAVGIAFDESKLLAVIALCVSLVGEGIIGVMIICGR